jgi:hypothetical protein
VFNKKDMKRILIILVFIVFSFSALLAQPHWSVELQGGGVYNLPMPLIIRQNGFQDIKLTARYSTEPFTLPIYYDLRFSRWQNGKSWELEMIHHKLYLDNTTQEVQKFNISHGFNILFVNRGIEVNSFRYRAGVGMVIAHPESRIRGQEFGSSTDDNDLGYFLSGPALNVAAGRPFYLGEKFFINAEAKTTMAYSSIKIAQGRADVYNISFQLLLGAGMDSRRK